MRHALRHRPDHIVVGEVRGGEAADLLQALNTGHGGSLTTVHANNASSALSRLASCAMQAGGALPWEVTCRGVVDGIHLVVHMTRRGGRRFVEEAIEVSRATTRPPTVGSPNPSGGSTMKNQPTRSEPMESDEKSVRIETLDEFDRELARDGGEALEVPASLAEQYGLFPEDVGSEDEIRDASEDPHGPEEEEL